MPEVWSMVESATVGPRLSALSYGGSIMTTPSTPPAADAAETTTARQAIDSALYVHHGMISTDAAGNILLALTEAGLVVVERDDLELAVEWMDQSDNPWSGEAFQETWVDSLLMRDRLKDALAASYVARQGED